MNGYTVLVLILMWVYLGLSLDPSFTRARTDNLTLLVEELLEQLCPAVDICDANATTAELSPNGNLGENRVSCCKGCSCHPSCKEKMNCCFPDEIDKDSSNEQYTSRYECLHSSIVHLDEEVPIETPAFYTVVNAPTDGCVRTEPVKILPGLFATPSCDDTSFFPVYSETKDEIYKNVQCAYCHGVKDPTLFIPYLFCKNIRRVNTPLLQQFNYFETGQLSRRCRVVFRYSNPALLSSKRCYLKVIDTCQEDTFKLPVGFDRADFNIDIIQKLCELKVYSPFTDPSGNYKNVFCAMCGKTARKYVVLQCQKDLTDRFEEGWFTNLIDQKIVLEKNAQAADDNYPKACLNDKEKQKSLNSCRRLYCPTGRTFNTNSECTFISKYWQSPAELMVAVKLSPMEGEDFRSQIIEMDKNLLQEALLVSIPWPAEWTFWVVFVRSDMSVCDDRVNIIVELLAKASQPANLIAQIEQSIKVYWPLAVDGRSVTFKQSLLDYTLHVHFDTITVPAANRYQDDFKVFGCDEIIFKSRTFIKIAPPMIINKLVLCRQVQLKSQEFTLGPRNTYVSSNLTRRMLFGNEFELVMTEAGNEARVCVADTFFVLSGTNQGDIRVPGQFIVLMVPLLPVVIRIH